MINRFVGSDTKSPAVAHLAQKDDKSFGPDDWAWEFLRRSPDYLTAWRAAVPRYLPHVRLADDTYLLRLRRRYPVAERFGLYAFADPGKPAGRAPIFWLAGGPRRLVNARCLA